jgi:tetratricopeptide (TPR) repeat protein
MQLADPNAGLGHRIGAHALLRTALTRIETDSTAQAASRIAVLDTLAQALQAFELFDEAIRARTLTHALLLEAHGPEHADTLAALRQLALALRGRSADRARAEQLFVDLRAIRLRQFGAAHPLSADSAWDLGFFYLRYADPAHPRRAEAKPLLFEAWSRHAETLGEDDPRTAAVLFDLGLATADRAVRIERMRRAIALRERALGPDDAQLLQHQGDLALVLGEAGDAEAAIALGLRAAEGFRRLRGDLHPLTITLWNNLAGIYRDHGRYGEALALYRQLDERVRAVVPEGHLRRAFPQFGLGFCLNRLTRHAEAEAPLRAALAIVEGAGRLAMQAATLRELGDSLRGQQRDDEARAQFEAALRILVEQLGRSGNDPDVQVLRERLGPTT